MQTGALPPVQTPAPVCPQSAPEMLAARLAGADSETLAKITALLSPDPGLALVRLRRNERHARERAAAKLRGR